MAIDVSKMSREDKIATLSAGANEAGRKRKAQEEAQGIQRKTPIFQARGIVAYRTKETPKPSTQENQKLQDLTNNTVDSLTATAYKRQRPAASMANFQDLTPESQQGTDIAQKTLDAYIASPQRQAAMQREQDWINARQTGQAASDQAPKDETLERLQAAARKEQAANQERKDVAADRAVYDEDMREISGMTDAERQQLKDYVSVRDLGRTENLITDLIYIPIKKRKAAGSLWDKYGEARLNELAETYARDLHRQERQEVQQAAQNASQGVGGAALTTLGSIVAKPIGSVAALEGRLDELGQRTGRYSTLDPYSPGDTVNNFFDDAKQNVQQQIEGDGSNVFRKGAAVLYQAGTGAAENVLGAITLGRWRYRRRQRHRPADPHHFRSLRPWGHGGTGLLTGHILRCPGLRYGQDPPGQSLRPCQGGVHFCPESRFQAGGDRNDHRGRFLHRLPAAGYGHFAGQF